MPVRTADAEWRGGLQDGNGTMKFGGGAFEGAYSFGSRFADAKGANPEELIAAAEAGCFSMALAADLGRAGFTPKRVTTAAKAHIERGDAGFAITKIELETVADVPGIDAASFAAIADKTKKNCPVSKALTGTTIILNARLAG